MISNPQPRVQIIEHVPESDGEAIWGHLQIVVDGKPVYGVSLCHYPQFSVTTIETMELDLDDTAPDLMDQFLVRQELLRARLECGQ